MIAPWTVLKALPVNINYEGEYHTYHNYYQYYFISTYNSNLNIITWEFQEKKLMKLPIKFRDT